MTTTSDRSGARPESRPMVVQELLDGDSRPVPPALRHVGDAAPGAATVARGRYTDAAVHELEVERIWKRTWQMACRLEQIPEPGDSIVYDVAGMSLVIVRRGPREVRAFHNSCLHRGTQLRTQPGRIGELRCPFHAFTWNLDGTFAGMPCPWDFPDVDVDAFCLPEAKVGLWGGFVFVHFDPDAPDLEDYLEILPEHFRSWPLEERYVTAHVVRRIACNWKVALEAFIESYHTVAVHPQLLTTSGDTQTQYDVWEGVRHVSRMITPVGIASEHVAHPVTEQEIADAMFLRPADAPPLEEGTSARDVLADEVRRQLAERTGRSFEQLSDSEALDAIEYFVFPNFVPWASYTTPLVYRFRPDGADHRHCLMDLMVLEPVPAGGRPAPTPTRHLEPGQRWADAPELGFWGRIIDQDTATMARVQRGLEAAAGPDVVFSHYQESRLRHFHATYEEYLAGGDGARG